MRRLTRVSAVLVGVLGVGAVCTLGPVACTSSATGTGIGDSGPDTGADVIVHHPDTGLLDAGHDAPKDVTISDVVQHDTGSDTGIDTGHDAPRDVVSDAQDSGADVGQPDARPEAVAFPMTVATTYCTKLASCCGETPSQFSIAACTRSLYDSPNLVPSQLELILHGLNSTDYNFDPVQAQKCLTDIESLGCGSSSATSWKKVATDCAGAYSGSLATGDKGCLSSFDCKTGNYCAPLDPAGNTVAPDGGGTCTALVATGGHCVDVLSSSDCTYLGLGTPAQYCNNVIGDAGQEGDGGFCAPSLASGTACNYPGFAQECQSLQCLPTVDAGFLVYDYACTDSAGLTQIAGVPQCLLFPPDGG